MLRGVLVSVLLLGSLYFCAVMFSNEMDRVSCDPTYKGHPDEHQDCKSGTAR